MHQAFEDYYKVLQTKRDQAADVLLSLPQEALDWKPADHMNSIAVLAAHIAGSVPYWITDVAGQVDIQRDRDAEFRVKGEDGAALLARIDAGLARAHETLDTLDLEDMMLMRIARRDGREVSVVWALTHAAEHMGEHVGHLQVMRDFWQLGKR